MIRFLHHANGSCESVTNGNTDKICILSQSTKLVLNASCRKRDRKVIVQQSNLQEKIVILFCILQVESNPICSQRIGPLSKRLTMFTQKINSVCLIDLFFFCIETFYVMICRTIYTTMLVLYRMLISMVMKRIAKYFSIWSTIYK